MQIHSISAQIHAMYQTQAKIHITQLKAQGKIHLKSLHKRETTYAYIHTYDGTCVLTGEYILVHCIRMHVATYLSYLFPCRFSEDETRLVHISKKSSEFFFVFITHSSYSILFRTYFQDMKNERERDKENSYLEQRKRRDIKIRRQKKKKRIGRERK